MVRACSELREALAKVSSSTKTAFLRSSFWSDSRFEAISVRLVMAPLHLSLPFPLSSIAISDFSLSLRFEKEKLPHYAAFLGLSMVSTNGPVWDLPANPVGNDLIFCQTSLKECNFMPNRIL